MSYTHLTQEERYQISEMLMQQFSQKAIAEVLGRHPGTLSRELKRNKGEKKWSFLVAQEKADKRKAHNRRTTVMDADWQKVISYLHLGCSPQQAIARLELEGTPVAMSHETIYQWIYADKEKGGKLYLLLRSQKVYRKRYGSGKQRRGVLKNRVGIEHRPIEVEQKKRIGDWEGDTVIGARQQGVIVTLVERFSRYTLAKTVRSKHARGVCDAVISLLAPSKDRCFTITFDNGKEFANHTTMAQALGTDIYFARPYHSWERGLNENTNGLIRQYHPKKSNLKQVTHAQLAETIYKLNHRPRKCLGFRTPHEVFFGLDILPLKSSNDCTS